MGSAVDPKGQPLLVQQNRYQPDTALPPCPLWICGTPPAASHSCADPSIGCPANGSSATTVKIRALESASCAVGEDVDLCEAV